MELKYVIPNMEKTFGVLEYAGEGQATRGRIGDTTGVIARNYNLFSSIQKADDIKVIIPAVAKEKHFEFEEPVRLINPRIIASGLKIGTRGFTDYILEADDIVKA